MGNDDRRGMALALFGALVLVPDTLCMRLSGLDAWQMMAWRGLLYAAVMLGLWVATSTDRSGDLGRMAGWAGAFAVLSQAMNSAGFAYAIGNAPVSIVLFGLATVPVWSAIVGHFVLGDRAGWPTILTSIAVIGGIGLSVSGDLGTDDGALLGGVVGIIIAMAIAGTFTIYRARPDLNIPLALGVGAAVSVLPGLALTSDLAPQGASLPAIWISGGLILPLSFWALTRATRHTASANVSLFMLLETVLGPAAVWVVVGEAMDAREIAGGAIVVGALTAYLLRRRNRAITGS